MIVVGHHNQTTTIITVDDVVVVVVVESHVGVLVVVGLLIVTVGWFLWWCLEVSAWPHPSIFNHGHGFFFFSLLLFILCIVDQRRKKKLVRNVLWIIKIKTFWFKSWMVLNTTNTSKSLSTKRNGKIIYREQSTGESK